MAVVMREGDAAEVVGNGAADGGCSRKAGREGGHVGGDGEVLRQ